jgi:hypothetical protein
MYARLNSALALLFASSAICSGVIAQSNVDSANKLAWSENVGWLNWRDAGTPIASQGAKVGINFLSGFIWSENTGWINLGDGSPANTITYSNTNGTDFGVNRDPSTGNLSGFAWGENVGWINFGPFPGSSAAPSRAFAGRLNGYAWSENLGWINLDLATPGKFVAFTLKCNAADIATLGGSLGPDGQNTADDLIAFLNAFFAGNTSVADLSLLGGSPGADGLLTADDLIYFLGAFFSPCN